jgi:hypothetical protein
VRTCSYWCDTLHSYSLGHLVTDTPTPPPPPQRNLFVWAAVAAVLVLLALYGTRGPESSAC